MNFIQLMLVIYFKKMINFVPQVKLEVNGKYSQGASEVGFEMVLVLKLCMSRVWSLSENIGGWGRGVLDTWCSPPT